MRSRGKRSQTAIWNLLKELGLETYPQFHTGTKFMQIEGAQVKSYRSDIPPLSFLALIDMQLFTMKVERLRKTIDSKDPYKCQRGKELDSKSLETFLKESLWTTGAYKLLEIVLRTDTGLDPSQMSTLSFLDGVASAGGLDNLLGMEENQAQGLKVKGGTQQISQIMAKKIGLENVLLEHPVDEIIQVSVYV
ncbi:putative flavin-containing monoamine oxidase AofH isoform X2 [Argopecten irradians]|uniref:putative flavin-containing monoamine oxidase AofH isoform X2 n=1 Tax=Argopecten irradians TaxID=31199 RepID=UPI0037116041